MSAIALRPASTPGPRVVDVTGAVAITDAELVARARARDAWAEEMIYRRHAPQVASTARRLLRDPVEAADVVQETFLIAFQKLEALAEPAALRGWLARIAVSRVHRRWRWRRVRFWSAMVDDESLAEVADGGVAPDRRTELALIDGALRAMPVKLRVPWVLRHVIGYSLDEVATACDCSLASVKRYLGRAEAAVAAHTHEVDHG
ncbi:MAG: sigma-70 family RNA polymerase sigma factor [Myxococcales bacterium]|nr:sigma-70 family RNA polymerase sigma factor [Myxococcales bacterium]